MALEGVMYGRVVRGESVWGVRWRCLECRESWVWRGPGVETAVLQW